jgi:Ca-activated chloride channel homolog
VVMMHAWAIPVVIGVVVVLGALGLFFRRRRATRSKVTWVANASYLTSLPAFRSRLSRYRLLLAVLAVVLAGSTVATGMLAARPVDRQVQSEELASRDIVLCLDISGSMIEFDTEVVERFLELMPSFNGERVALSIWNSTSRTVFPLTDDYQLVEDELRYASDVLDFDVDSLDDWSFDMGDYNRLVEFIGGTQGMGDTQSSLVGDGLATCALMFDEEDTERSRSIILATDNEVLGDEVYPLPEAGALVADRDITLFGIYAGSTTATSQAQRAEYQEVVEGNGGLFFDAEDPDLVPQVIDQIAAQQAVDLDADTDVVVTDRPQRYFAWLLAAVGIYVVAIWRLRT